MKKIFLIIFVVYCAYAFYNDWSYNSQPVEYVTPEDSVERVTENLIRDVWGDKHHWEADKKEKEYPISRVISIRTYDQVDGTKAIDMRIRANKLGTASEFIFDILKQIQKFFPKCLAEDKLSGYNEFRFYFSHPMTSSRESNVVKLCLTRSEAQKISWEELDVLQLHKLLTSLAKTDNKCEYWIHGSILSEAKYVK